MTGPSSIEPRPVLAPPIFPGRRQPGIVGRNELNYRVRNGNGWTLALISTNCVAAKSAQPCSRHKPAAFVENCVRSLAPPLRLRPASPSSEPVWTDLYVIR